MTIRTGRPDDGQALEALLSDLGFPAERGCGLVEITSNQRLTEAHAFYQYLGYEVTSVRFRKTL